MTFEYFTYLCDCKLLAHLWNGTLYDWQNRFRFHVVPESWCECRQHSQSPQETPPPLVKKLCLFWSISSSVDGHLMKFLCFCARASETWLIIRDTDDFEKPRVSSITWRKLPEAKKRNATRICTVVDEAWFRDVSLSRSSRRSSDKNSMDSRPKRYRLLNSSPVKLDREKSSGSLDVLSFLLGAGIRPNPPSNKSAILFCLGEVFPRFVS